MKTVLQIYFKFIRFFIPGCKRAIGHLTWPADLALRPIQGRFSYSFSYGVIIHHRWVWLYSPRKASFNNNIVFFSFLREVSMPCSDIYFSLLCFAYGFKNLNGKFPWLNKNYVSGSFTSFLTSQARRQVSLSW